jgi:hypothetical protein
MGVQYRMSKLKAMLFLNIVFEVVHYSSQIVTLKLS